MCLVLDNIIDDSGGTKGEVWGDYKLSGVGEEMEFSLFKLWKRLCLKITGCSV